MKATISGSGKVTGATHLTAGAHAKPTAAEEAKAAKGKPVDLDAKAAAKAGLGGDATSAIGVAALNATAFADVVPWYKAPSAKSRDTARFVIERTLTASMETAKRKAKKQKGVPPTRNQLLLELAEEYVGTHNAIAEGTDKRLEGKTKAQVAERQTFSRAFLGEITRELWASVPIDEALKRLPEVMGMLLHADSPEAESLLSERLERASAAQGLRYDVGMVNQAAEHDFKISPIEKKLLLQADKIVDADPDAATAMVQSIVARAEKYLDKKPPEYAEMSKKQLLKHLTELKAAKKAPDPKDLLAAAKVHKKALEASVKDAPEPPSVQERFRGAMIGLAIGDALGGPTEFMEKAEIRQKYGMVTDMVGGGWLHLEPGEYTDDTQMAVAMAESIVKHGTLDGNDVADRFVTWLNTDPKDVGGLTSQALELRRVGVDGVQAGKIPWQLSGFENAGNGSVMRAAPVALLTAFAGRKEIAQAARDSSAITHADDRCTWGTAAISLAVSMIMKGEEDVTAKVAEWLETRSPELADALHEIPNLTLSKLRTSGYVVHTLQAAFWALDNAKSYPDGVIKVSNLGEDTDTAGATAGILLGAKFGLEGIPVEWREKLQNSKKLEGLANKIHTLATQD